MRGADKLLEEVAGRPVLATLAARALEAGAPVLVTIAPGQEARAQALAGLPVELREVPEAAEGMAASLRVAAAEVEAEAAAHAGLMVLPADMPEITGDDIARMIAAFRAAAEPRPILRATAEDGRWGHPVILPRRLMSELARLQGDRGGRDILKAHAAAVQPCRLPGARALTDLDTPEDWAAWRARLR